MVTGTTLSNPVILGMAWLKFVQLTVDLGLGRESVAMAEDALSGMSHDWARAGQATGWQDLCLQGMRSHPLVQQYRVIVSY